MNFWHQVRLFVPALIAVYGLSLAPAQAQFYQQGPKLVGTGAVGPYNPIQGSSVSLSGDGNTALVGGIYDTQKDGAAWVFTRSAGVWSQQAKLVGAGIVGHNAFQGLSVSLSSDGNTALVGGPDDDGQVGAAWVFTRADATWSQQAKLVPIDAVGVAGMGNSSSLASDGNTAIVGGPGDDNGVGAAWVFTRSPNGTWTQQAKLVGTGAIGNAVQGYSTSISGDGKTAIVGGTFDNNQIVTAPGAAWVFARSADGTWSQQAKLVGTGAVGNNAQQGFSVALSGDGSIAIVGGPYDDNQASSNGQGLGAAWVFTRSADGSWSQQAKLVGTGAIGNPGQGSSVSLSGDGNTAVIGGPYDNLPVNGSVGVGAAWVFARSADGTWSQRTKLIGTGAIGDALQGNSVSLSADGSTVIVGGPYDNLGYLNRSYGVGAAWVFAPFAGTPGAANCVGASTQTLVREFGGLNAAAAGTGFSSISALQNAILMYCDGSGQVASTSP